MSDLGFQPESSDFTNYVGLVVEAKFQVNEYNGNPELALKMRTDSPKLPEYTERYSLGQTTNNALWVVLDDGARVQASDGAINFRDNSNYGKWISAAVEAAKINPSTGRSPDGRQWDGTRESSTWLGTKWHMKQIKGSFTNRESGEKVEWRKNVPDTYLGWEEVSGVYSDAPGTPASTNPGAGSSGSASAMANPSARPVTDFAEVLKELDADTLGTMIRLSKSCSHGQWVDEVMDQLPEILTNGTLMTEISRADGLYASLRNTHG